MSRRRGQRAGPMAALEEWMDAAKKVDSVEVEIPAGDDPLEGLQELIGRARREAQGKGGEALRRLEEKIEAARKLPEPGAYRRSEEDPLAVLMARIRGEYDEAKQEGIEDGGERAFGEDTDQGAVGAETGRHEEMGAALEASLKGRPLSGQLRAQVAARLARMMDGASGDEILELWELVVFGDSGLGSRGQDG